MFAVKTPCTDAIAGADPYYREFSQSQLDHIFSFSSGIMACLCSCLLYLIKNRKKSRDEAFEKQHSKSWLLSAVIMYH